MMQLSLIAISYLSLLVLLMESTGSGVISALVWFVLGIGAAVCTKLHKKDIWRRHRFAPMLLSVSIAATWVEPFFSRWIVSSKMGTIADILHLSPQTMLLLAACTLALPAVYLLNAGMQLIYHWISQFYRQHPFAGSVLFCVLASLIAVILGQIGVRVHIFSMGYPRFLWGVWIVFAVVLFFYVLFGRVIPAVSLGMGIFMLILTINVYTYQFRGRMFEPTDIFTATTALNVLGSYSLFPIPITLLSSWGIFIALLAALYSMERRTPAAQTAKRRIALMAACAVSFAAVVFYCSGLITHHWDKGGVQLNGYILDFAAKFKEISPAKPKNYSVDAIDTLAERYAAELAPETVSRTQPPHIIVIMDEAFSDLSVLGDFAVSSEIMPTISSLKENTIFGHVLVSVYGGNTANSEYEFLTGNSLAWLSPNAVPYQQYVRASAYSMVSYLKSCYPYKCVAMHPYKSTGWNRPETYRNFGFDECYFEEAFPQEDILRGFVSDREMFDYLMDYYTAQKAEPLFILGVTMQNHGSYNYYGEDYTATVTLEDFEGEFYDAEQYLSSIQATDRAVEHLISYFQEEADDVIIVFFGDHQPKLDAAFYEAIGSHAANSLGEQQKLYQVPFFIWANYDIAEADIDLVSLNYLSSYVYDAAGIPLPPYNRFLRDMEAAVPAINANGFYSPAANGFLPFESANEEENQWLNAYEALQYNCLFDAKHRNEVLFPG